MGPHPFYISFNSMMYFHHVVRIEFDPWLGWAGLSWMASVYKQQQGMQIR